MSSSSSDTLSLSAPSTTTMAPVQVASASSIVPDAAPAGDEQPQTAKVRLADVEVKGDKQMAFRLIMEFLNHASKQGAFTIDESHKIWECINTFKG